MTITDPRRFPDLGTGLWWAASTVTTVGYGDVVPATAAGRAAGVVLMFVGIGSIAFLTAVAASAIVVGEVSAEGERIESEERAIENEQESIFARLVAIDARLHRIETAARTRGGRHRRGQNRPYGVGRP